MGPYWDDFRTVLLNLGRPPCALTASAPAIQSLLVRWSHGKREPMRRHEPWDAVYVDLSPILGG